MPAHARTSIGVLCLDERFASGDVALAAADSACYVAKQTGRDRAQMHRAEGSALPADGPRAPQDELRA